MALERFELPRYRTDITLFYLYHYLSDEDRPAKSSAVCFRLKRNSETILHTLLSLEVSSFESPYVYIYLYQRPFLLLFLWLLLALLVRISSEFQYYLLSLIIRRSAQLFRIDLYTQQSLLRSFLDSHRVNFGIPSYPS